jgi:hypothetical protein
MSVDVLLGTKPPKRVKQLATNRLERRLAELEKLEPADRRQLLQLIDAFIERGQLKRKATRQAA